MIVRLAWGACGVFVLTEAPGPWWAWPQARGGPDPKPLRGPGPKPMGPSAQAGTWLSLLNMLAAKVQRPDEKPGAARACSSRATPS